jgi:F-type H+-transporting ATPase subunit b
LELSWTTFLLEVVNFLVLVWILKRFLYKPVLNVIARRREVIDAQLDEARRLHDEANALKADYENRLADWNEERQQLRDTLAHDLDAERSRQLELLQSTLAQEREKAQAAETHRRNQVQHDLEHAALKMGSRFATRLLDNAVTPALESRLVQMLLDDLQGLSGDQLDALRKSQGERPDSIQVASAFPLSEDQRRAMEKTLSEISQLDVPFSYRQQPELLAGLRITIGAWVLHLNLQDELKGFSEFAYVDR